MDPYKLPKPFKAQKVTNGNANEVITNYIIKTGYNVPYTKEGVSSMYKDKKLFNIIQHDEHNDIITFSKYKEISGYYIEFPWSIIIEDMKKNDYSFNVGMKQLINAEKEIEIRMMHIRNSVNEKLNLIIYL